MNKLEYLTAHIDGKPVPGAIRLVNMRISPEHYRGLGMIQFKDGKVYWKALQGFNKNEPTEFNNIEECNKHIQEAYNGVFYPQVGQRVVFKKQISNHPSAFEGDTRTIKAIIPYPCESDQGKKTKILIFEEDSERYKPWLIACGWCKDVHTLDILTDIHLDTEFEPYIEDTKA